VPHRVFIVDDNPSVRTGIRTLLENSGFEICGEASDGLDAVERAPEINPDLIILDVSMPRMNGLDAARKLRDIHPSVPILLNPSHAAVIRSEASLPEGVTAVVDKRENLLHRVLQFRQFAVHSNPRALRPSRNPHLTFRQHPRPAPSSALSAQPSPPCPRFADRRLNPDIPNAAKRSEHSRSSTNNHQTRAG
jgi:DNA-binding NarL/FixJ family response regulator